MSTKANIYGEGMTRIYSSKIFFVVDNPDISTLIVEIHYRNIVDFSFLYILIYSLLKNGETYNIFNNII